MSKKTKPQDISDLKYRACSRLHGIVVAIRKRFDKERKWRTINGVIVGDNLLCYLGPRIAIERESNPDS